jgi:hypothetical protein
MYSKPTILEIATTKYETDRELVSSAMDSLQTICGVKDGFLMSKPVERFGWAFFKVLIKSELLSAMQLKLADQITNSKGKKYEEKFLSFMTQFFENKNTKVKVKLAED